VEKLCGESWLCGSGSALKRRRGGVSGVAAKWRGIGNHLATAGQKRSGGIGAEKKNGAA
jgi:hypothetical protein